MNNTDSIFQVNRLLDCSASSSRLIILFMLSLITFSFSLTISAFNQIEPKAQAQVQAIEWKISGDSSTIDLQNQQIVYRGNASFSSHNIVIKGDLIKANQGNGASQSKTIVVHGKPALLTQTQHQKTSPAANSAQQNNEPISQQFKLKAQQVNFTLPSNHLTAEHQVELTLTETAENAESMTITADKMVSQGENNLSLIFHGSPLILIINQSEQPSMSAQAEHLIFNQLNSQFELSGNVVVTTGSEIIKAEKLRYNSLSQLIEIPQGSKPVQMSQPKEANNE